METRQLTWQCEVRASSVSERIVTVQVVPYDEVSYDTPYEEGESFAPGSLTKSLREAWSHRPLKLFRSHDHGHAIGLSESLEDRARGLYGDFRIARTPYGDDALAEVEQRLLDSVSVGFRAITVRRGRKGQREIAEAALMEASLCPMGAYQGARVLATRTPHNDDEPAPYEAAGPLLVPAPPMPYIDLTRPIYQH